MVENEEWRDIEGYEGLYQVSSLGNIRSLDREVNCIKNGKEQIIRFKGKIMCPTPDKKNGYCYIKPYVNNIGKKCYVHRLVARAFPEICGEWFEGCDTDHLNTVKSDNRAVNLRVCTRKENMNNPITLDYMNLYWSKHIEQYSKDGVFIREFESLRDAQRQLGISKSSIIQCCRGRSKTSGGYIWRYKKEVA